jgi:hypothetical protein
VVLIINKEIPRFLETLWYNFASRRSNGMKIKGQV